MFQASQASLSASLRASAARFAFGLIELPKRCSRDLVVMRRRMRPNGTVGKLPLAKVIGLAAETKTARAGLVARADGWLEAVWCAGWESAAWKPPQRDPASTYQPIGMAAGVNGLGDANLEKLWSVASVFASWKAFPPSAVASPASLRGGAATTLARCP